MPEISEKELKTGKFMRPKDNSFEEFHGDLFPMTDIR